MLKSYEAVYEDGQLKWLGDHPSSERAKVIVTVLEQESEARSVAARRAAFARAEGCARPRRSIEEIDADIREMRAEWEREWDQ